MRSVTPFNFRVGTHSSLFFTGTLTIGTRGETIFMSGTARSEVSPGREVTSYLLNLLVVSHTGVLHCDYISVTVLI